MQERSVIQEFANKFQSELSIVEEGEHYFHIEEQLEIYQKWLNESAQ